MTSFLVQLKLIFGHSVGEGAFTHLNFSPPQGLKRRKRSDQRQRDAILEERSRAMLFPLAPALAPLVTVGWNPRMRTTAGIAVASRWEVWLNPSLRDISQTEVEKTLLHELAHLLAHHRHGRRRLSPHGPEWRQACSDLGIPGEKRTHQLPLVGRVMKRRYRLRCPGCGESHRRVRRPRRRMACLACCRAHNGGAYDERFRFDVFTIAD